MKNGITIKQISSILNAWNKANFTHENANENLSVIAHEDLSNYADFGKSILDNDFNDIMNAVGDLIGRVANTIFINAKYEKMSPPVYKDYMSYRGLTEVVKVSGTEFTDSMVFDIVTDDETVNKFYTNSNTFEKLFGKKLPDLKAKYFNRVLPYEQKITVGKEQFIKALGDVNAVTDLFSAWENQLSIAREYAIDVMNYVAFDSLVITVAEQRPNESVIATNFGLSDNSYTDADITEVAKQFRANIRRFKAYNSDFANGFTTSLNNDDIGIVCSGEFYDAIIESKKNMYNPEFLGIPLENITVLQYMQSPVLSNSMITGRSVGTPDGEITTINNIQYVIYDKRAVGTSMYNESVEHQYIPNERCTNVFHLASQGIIVLPELAVLIATENGAQDISHTSI